MTFTRSVPFNEAWAGGVFGLVICHVTTIGHAGPHKHFYPTRETEASDRRQQGQKSTTTCENLCCVYPNVCQNVSREGVLQTHIVLTNT